MKCKQLFRCAMVAAAFALLAVTGSCSSDSQEDATATPTTYQAQLVLKAYSDPAKVRGEMADIESTFLTYLNAQSLNSFSFDEGSSEANDAAAVRQCKLAAAVVGQKEYSASYVFFLIKQPASDTIYSFRPTASNYRMEDVSSDFDVDLLP